MFIIRYGWLNINDTSARLAFNFSSQHVHKPPLIAQLNIVSRFLVGRLQNSLNTIQSYTETTNTIMSLCLAWENTHETRDSMSAYYTFSRRCLLAAVCQQIHICFVDEIGCELPLNALLITTTKGCPKWIFASQHCELCKLCGVLFFGCVLSV